METIKLAIACNTLVSTEEEALDAYQKYLAWNGYDESDSEPENFTSFYDDDEESEHFQKTLVYPAFGVEAANAHYDHVVDSDLIFDTEDSAEEYIEAQIEKKRIEFLADIDWLETPFAGVFLDITHIRGSYPQSRICILTVGDMSFSGSGNSAFLREAHSEQAVAMAWSRLKDFVELAESDDPELLNHPMLCELEPSGVKRILNQIDL